MNKSWKDVKEKLKALIEAEQISDNEVIRKAGLSRNTYYKLFTPDREYSTMRKSTVFALAKVLHQHVKYLNEIPQFSNIDKFETDVPVNIARPALLQLIDIAGGVEALSARCRIAVAVLQDLISPDQVTRESIPRSFLIKTGSQYGQEFTIDSSENAMYVPREERLRYPHDTDIRDRDDDLKNVLDDPETVSDIGLQNLFLSTNIDKYDITEREIKVLSAISAFEDSQASIENWVIILYGLRALGSSSST